MDDLFALLEGPIARRDLTGFVTALLTAGTFPARATLAALVALSFTIFELVMTSKFIVEPIEFWFAEISPAAAADRKKLRLTAEGTATRIVRNVHNVIGIGLGLICLTEPTLVEYPLTGRTTTSEAIIGFSTGFFLWDVIVAVRDIKKDGFAMLAHGISCCMVFTYGFFSGTHHWMGAGFILWEISTPFVHVRWTMLALGLTEHPAYFANAAVMTVAFFLCRIVWGYFLSFRYWVAVSEMLSGPKPYPIPLGILHTYRIANIILNGLNTFWFHLMVSKVLARVLGGPEKRKSVGGSAGAGGAAAKGKTRDKKAE